MSIYDYEQAFGAADQTSRAMRQAIREWFALYYNSQASEEADPCQRIAYTVVNKITRTVFGEYSACAQDPVTEQLLAALNCVKQQAMQLVLMGGECYLKPCPEENGFRIVPVSRENVLIFARNAAGEPVDMGMLERSVRGKYYYTLLERRSLDETGRLVLENKLFRSLNGQNLGQQVELGSHPDYAALPERYCFPVPLNGLGLVRMKTPMVNCVDGSMEGVSVYAAAAGLIRNIDRNEAQLNGEFERGESRILLSADLLGQEGLQEHLFLGLDDDPDRVGITLFSPQLRQQAFLERKQEYLRNVESLIGLKRGMLSDANVEERTATEITASAADYSLTVMDFQQMWAGAVHACVALCARLAELYALAVPENTAVSIDWGNGVLYDEEKLWEQYMEMVQRGILRPEVALGWRFGMEAKDEAQLARIRKQFMPRGKEEQ